MREVARLIEKEIKNNNLTIAQFSERTGINQTCIYCVISGKNNMGFKNVQKLIKNTTISEKKLITAFLQDKLDANVVERYRVKVKDSVGLKIGMRNIITDIVSKFCISITEIAKIIGVDVSLISHIRNGTMSAGFETIKKLSNEFNMDYKLMLTIKLQDIVNKNLTKPYRVTLERL